MDRSVQTAEAMVRVLDEEGVVVDPTLEPDLPADFLWRAFEGMLTVRAIDERMLMLQRQGRIAFYGAATGQEAAVVGSGLALAPQDWVFPALREVGVALLRGYSLQDLAHQLFGTRDDILKGRQMPCHYSDRRVHHVAWSSCVGNQVPQAVGAAMAARYLGDPVVVMAYLGDGATSEGDFHVAMNFAAVFRAPVVFFCQNNQWAISVPVSRQTASETIAVKAVAYGMEGVRVDGNDLLAVYQVTRRAVEKARAGGGPTLIEAFTYRIGAHSTSDDPSRYRNPEEVERWRQRDPIERFRRYLIRKGLWDADREQALVQRIRDDLMAAVQKAESTPPPPVESLFEDVYATPPWHLREQQTALEAYLREKARWTDP
ncbi:Pyruvate dehydrogenase E1 component subunit alpha [bacterium HR11]|nr:Pyruvate dehydrogenase E1 component subunit alpha [bacterium HR11]